MNNNRYSYKIHTKFIQIKYTLIVFNYKISYIYTKCIQLKNYTKFIHNSSHYL